MSKFITEIERRRTFGIVSHPDAGKTTLTEKLLLFGGAIRVAGAVKSNKIKKTAMSDFMEIERQRGISVATSVMGFEYKDIKINILDTPGHADFAEDTYRTLTAVDSVIIVIDVAKGVETQTEKLMEVCRMRNTPVMIFINKMDRPASDIFEILDEIEDKLKIKVAPMTWPMGSGKEFKGVFDIYQNEMNLFRPNITSIAGNRIKINNINDKRLDDFAEGLADKLREDVELVTGVYPSFNQEEYLSGQVAPLFFGSALYNFGVEELLNCFIKFAPFPKPSFAIEREVKPNENKFSGFVFKIHANMDPNHRNRLAFVKICSGTFERNKSYYHVRLDRKFKFSSPTTFMADKKEIIDFAYPGDIIGIPDNGNFKIGDTITEGEIIHFKGIPSFSPEIFKYISNVDPLKNKQLNKGIMHLMDEGVAQLFTRKSNNRKIIGTVGNLQFEVLAYRLEHEYGASSRYEPIELHKAYWVKSDDKDELEKFIQKKYDMLAVDKDDQYVFLATSQWNLTRTQELFPKIEFYLTSEMQ